MERNRVINAVMFALIPFAALAAKLIARDAPLDRLLLTMAYCYGGLLVVFGGLCAIPILTDCFSNKLKGAIIIILCIVLSVVIANAMI